MKIKPCINCGEKAKKTKKTGIFYECTKCSCKWNYVCSDYVRGLESDLIAHYSVTIGNMCLYYGRFHGPNGGVFVKYNYSNNHEVYASHQISDHFIMPQEAIKKEKVLRYFY